jgi:hypothetical protein
MPEDSSIPLKDHELADDELAWMKAVYADFGKIRASFSGREKEFNPKDALREVLGSERHRLAPEVDLSGPGPWRLGQNRHGRGSPPSFCREWNCIDTREAEPTSFPCMWSARRTHFPSVSTHSPC